LPAQRGVAPRWPAPVIAASDDEKVEQGRLMITPLDDGKLERFGS